MVAWEQRFCSTISLRVIIPSLFCSGKTILDIKPENTGFLVGFNLSRGIHFQVAFVRFFFVKTTSTDLEKHADDREHGQTAVGQP